MSFVAMNVVTVPPDKHDEFERRFRARQGAVEKRPGFLGFWLLRPETGDRYVVLTLWQRKQDFLDWVSSEDFAAGHRHHGQQPPVATDSELWTFQSVIETSPDSGRSG